MLTKLETKSVPVKGLSFHPKKTWILASLESGVIQLWDYRVGKLINTFEEHQGPVRGLHFHNSHPVFVSGGDDKKIKLWNYETQKCVFTFLGHRGCVRSVQFHHIYPWIVSGSDDLAIRLWDWIKQESVIPFGTHTGPVNSVSFHPTRNDNLVVSTSLDHTVRVTNVIELTEHILKGHKGGVNSAFFHPTLPLVVSGADDSHVKLWQMKKIYGQNELWEEVGTLAGHLNSVSSVVFQARLDIIVSCSEDRSICVWDATRRTRLETFRRRDDRFWILSVQPETKLMAAGHDSGMIVFKLERERPAFSLNGDSLLYAKDRSLWYYDFSTMGDSLHIPIRQPGTSILKQSPHTLSYSPKENAVLTCSDQDGGSYELYIIPKDSIGRSDFVQEPKRGSGDSAFFVSRNRFAVLEKLTNQVLIKNLDNEVVEKSSLPIPTDAIFYAGIGNILCRSEDKVVIFDLQQRLVLGDIETPFVKYVVWSKDMENVAFLSKHTIIIASMKLVHQCTVRETTRVKSGAWDDNGVFIYKTLNHIKYCLPNGDSGIILTLEVPIYITKVSGNRIFYLDRDKVNRIVTVDDTEYIIKLSLLRKRYDHVMSMIKNSELCGQVMVAYLKQKGFPDIALHFVEDERDRFDLALESGNIGVAVASATKINEDDYWCRLGAQALRQGNAGIVEFAYQQTKNFERLSFLYLITGNMDKLSKLMKIAEVKNNVMGQFHKALYLGDVKERVKILENAGHLPLAYITASVHGLHDIAERLASELGDNVPSLPEGKTPLLLMPPTPVMPGGDWPLLRAMKERHENEEFDMVADVNESPVMHAHLRRRHQRGVR